jgi:hypothetical protein
MVGSFGALGRDHEISCLDAGFDNELPLRVLGDSIQIRALDDVQVLAMATSQPSLAFSENSYRPARTARLILVRIVAISGG